MVENAEFARLNLMSANLQKQLASRSHYEYDIEVG